MFFFIKAEMSLISSKGEEQNWVTQTPQLNAIWMASIFIKKKKAIFCSAKLLSTVFSSFLLICNISSFYSEHVLLFSFTFWPPLPISPAHYPAMGSQRVGHDWATELNWTLASGNHQYVLCVYEFFFHLVVFFFLDSTYKRDHTVLDFSVWLISFSITPSRSIMLSKKWQNFLIFMAE